MKNFLTFLILVLFSNFIFAQDAKQSLPDIVLRDLNAKAVNIKSFSKDGKIVIVNFWATWCTPCKKELNNINEMYEDWKTKYNVVLIAVSIDNARNVMKVKPYVDGQAWSYEILLDVNSDLMRAMNVQNPPHTFLVDQNGNIVYAHNGYLEGDEFELEEKLKELTLKK